MEIGKVKERLVKEGIVVSSDEKTLREKSRDWSFVSPRLSHLSSKTADLVVFPRNEEEVVKVVEAALEEHVPLVPRGAGYGTVGGAIPLNGGIVVDMSLMNKIEFHEGYVEAEAGASFSFNARVYPTIWSKATVGGYFCGGSWGIGSYQYGPNWDQVVEVRMVNPKGKVVTLRGGDVKIAAHAEGTTGIVTRLKVLTRENAKDVAKLLTFDTLRDARKFLERVYEEALPVYHMTLRSPEMGKATEKVVGFYTGKWELLLVHQEGEVSVDGLDGSPLWNKRNTFFAAVYVNMRSVKNDLYYAQYHIPIEELEEKVQRVSEFKPVIEAEFASDWKAHTYFLTESPQSFLEMEKILGTSSFNLHDIRIDGRLPRDHLHRIKTYKKAFDKEELFNPGKVSL